MTREQIIAEAEKLGLKLSEEQISAYVTIGQLPTKGKDSSTDNNADDNDDNDDPTGDDKLPDGVKKRMSKLAEQKRLFKKQAEDNAKELKALKDRLNESDLKKSQDKGEWEKLSKEAMEMKTKFESAINVSKETIKRNAITSKVENALLKAGCIPDRLPSALKLFEIDKVEFSWVDEDNLTYDIDEESIEKALTNFKKENDFLFSSGEGDNGNPYNGRDQNKRKQSKDLNEEKQKLLEERFPALRIF